MKPNMQQWVDGFLMSADTREAVEWRAEAHIWGCKVVAHQAVARNEVTGRADGRDSCCHIWIGFPWLPLPSCSPSAALVAIGNVLLDMRGNGFQVGEEEKNSLALMTSVV